MPAPIKAAPPRKSVAFTVVPISFLAPLITQDEPNTEIFAPIFESSGTHLNLFSKIFSVTVEVPFATVNIDKNTDCISVGNPGYGKVFNSIPFNLLGAIKEILLFSL